MTQLTHERPHDAQAIETLLDRAFGPDRLRKTSYQYRTSAPPVPYLRFVVRQSDALIGTIRYWPVSVGSGSQALLLGPIAVDPDRESQGVGSTLMQHSLSEAAAAGHGAVLLVGDIDYYGRFGFRHAAPEGIVMPGESRERLLVRELVPGALRGVEGPLVPCGQPHLVDENGGWLPALADAGRWLTDHLEFELDIGLDIGRAPGLALAAG